MYKREQAIAIEAVREAAWLCQNVASAISPEVLAKKDKSPVTVADFGSQALICRTLAEAFPDDPIIAEEDATELKLPQNASLLDQVRRHVSRARSHTSGTGVADVEVSTDELCQWIDRGGGSQYSGRFWTLDPIDGTKGFLRREQYAVALALIVDGRVVVAALACPNLAVQPASRGEHGASDAGSSSGSIFHAMTGQGAYAMPVSSPTGEPGKSTRLRTTQHDRPTDARFCESVESGHSAQGDSASIAARLGIKAPPLRMDSQAKYAVVGRGEADIYLRLPTRADYREKIWDHAAGTLVVEEAGGVVTDIAGRPLEFTHGRELTANRGVVVSNGPLHAAVVDAVKALGIA